MAERDDQQRTVHIPAKAYGFPPDAFDWTILPDGDTDFLPAEDLEAFIQALSAPDPLQASRNDASPTRLSSPSLRSYSSLDITKRQSSVVEDDAQAVAAHAAAASAELAPPPSSSTTSSPNPLSSPPAVSHGSLRRQGSGQSGLFITAQNDWAPVNQKVVRPGVSSARRRRAARKAGAAAGGSGGSSGSNNSSKNHAALALGLGTRSKDETREGYLYTLLKWPFLLIVGGWILGLGVAYLATRLYIWLYEHYIAWRGRRERLRRAMRATAAYPAWVRAARELDAFLGNTRWREENDFAYYDSKTVRSVWEQMRRCRVKAEAAEREDDGGAGLLDSDGDGKRGKAISDLKALVEACVKNNFVGVENPRLYSQTYYGTKNLVQNFVDEVDKSLRFLIRTNSLSMEEKKTMFKGMHANYGRTALCLSGGAAFAYYHFGVVKALLEEDLLPDVITGTSGGALVAGLVATRTNEELKKLLVPALAHKITACKDPMRVWLRRWWKTGARFDSLDWARQCAWWTRGSMTFREAYERTGRILNVSCVPADPHSPTILCNYLTSPDCVIWSAVLASAAVPGILNPVVLMMKTRDGSLAPYSFGHKWKDGSLRTDIPIKALNLHFNVNFTIVSQVNPHINLFFFSSRGAVGQPVTHRRGRGWRGGYLGSAAEQYLKLDLNKWLKVLRQLELLPRPLGQDWSQLWLQQFGGTITIWPQSVPADFWYILSDPDEARLARMLHEGQQSCFPKLKFVANRLRIERLVEQGRRETRGYARRGSIESIYSEDELRGLLRKNARGLGGGGGTSATDEETTTDGEQDNHTTALLNGPAENGLPLPAGADEKGDRAETAGAAPDRPQ